MSQAVLSLSLTKKIPMESWIEEQFPLLIVQSGNFFLLPACIVLNPKTVTFQPTKSSLVAIFSNFAWFLSETAQ